MKRTELAAGDWCAAEIGFRDGMRHRITGKVLWTDGVGVMMTGLSVYAYHPDAPELGRTLPAAPLYLASWGELT